MSETVSGQDLHQWREWAIQLAIENNIAPNEVDWFLQELTPLKSLSLQLGNYQNQLHIPIQASLFDFTQKWQQRVKDRVPVQYLTGETPWRHFSLSVTPDVLIPRPETELIINIAEDIVTKNPITDQLCEGHWADIGTGSGAIALGLAQTFPNANIHATDISPQALNVAKHNATKNHLAHRITFHQGNWLTPLSTLKNQLSAIITNPPYIPTQTVLTLQPEVTHHEPHLALDGGSDGLRCIKTLIETSPNYLIPNGIWITELMQGQAQTVVDLLTQQGHYTHITIHPDLTGTDRFVSARRAI